MVEDDLNCNRTRFSVKYEKNRKDILVLRTLRYLYYQNMTCICIYISVEGSLKVGQLQR
jgi:hypothetical protein